MIRRKPAPDQSIQDFIPDPDENGNIVMRTTKDGRILGPATVDSVPDHLRNAIPQPKTLSSKTHSRKERQKSATAAHRIARKLFPLGEGPNPKVEEVPGKKYRIRELTQVRFNALIAGIRCGMTKEGACALAGIRRESLNTWIEKGERGMYPYTAISDAIKHAEAELQKELLEAIIAAGTREKLYQEITTETMRDDSGREVTKTKTMEKVSLPKWSAVAWLLERINPAFRLDNNGNGAENLENSPEQDLLMMEGTSTGTVESLTKEKLEIMKEAEALQADDLAEDTEES